MPTAIRINDATEQHEVKEELQSARRAQVGRLRRAWYEIMCIAEPREKDRAQVTVVDLDDLLSETYLADMKLQFWCRYKMKYPT